MNGIDNLVAKYNVPGPRYTSYPTVPYWDCDGFTEEKWINTLRQKFDPERGISLYIHLPFCEQMCTFCGCTKRITKNHMVEVPYVRALLKELSMYADLLGHTLKIQQLHLGGGTPTFFSAENLEALMIGIFQYADMAPDAAFSFEGHPNNTTAEHLRVLHRNGFTKVCYGVQDYNETVQKAINRIQPFEHVARATHEAREAGYTSVGHDLVYGLPFQTANHVKHSINQTLRLRPDRIAFYSYAHVPWIKGNGQRGYSETDLPSANDKRAQYELGKAMLLDAGYQEIGMDHFALPQDELSYAKQHGLLHRNFMGYTTAPTDIMLGLGVSAIGDSWLGFAQNVKSLEAYYKHIRASELPVFRGHILTREDEIIRKHILAIMCRFETSWTNPSLWFPQLPEILQQLTEMQKDGLVIVNENHLQVTEAGRPFVRNICLPFDLRLRRKRPETQVFSMTV